MRRIIAPVLVVTAALGLAACGDPKDLSQDQVKSAMIDASPVGSDYKAGDVDTTKPDKSKQDDSDPFKDAEGVTQSCKDAMKAVSDLSKADPKAYAKRTLTSSDSSGSSVEVVVEVLDKASDVPDKLSKVADECKTITMKAQGQEVKIETTSPDLGVDGGKSMQMQMSAAGQKQTLLMGAKAVGHNLVVVQNSQEDQGRAKDVVSKALKAQADKVEKAAS